MIGNPQTDKPDQASAYNRLRDTSDYEPLSNGGGYASYCEASYYLAECYVSGKTGEGGPIFARNDKGFPPNRPAAYTLAIPLYENGARHDYVQSLVRLYTLYFEGKYVPKDPDKAFTNLVSAARLDDKDSIKELLALSSTGFPEISNKTQIAIGIKVLAEKGFAEPQIEYAKLLISKNTKDGTDQAKALLAPLAESGNAAATSLLKNIEDKESAALAEQQKAAAEQAQQQEIDARQKATKDKIENEKRQAAQNEQTIAGNPSVQSQTLGGQSVTDDQPVKAGSDHETLWLVLGIILFLALLVLVILGVCWGTNEKIVIFWGKSDLVVSCIISFLCYMAIILLIDGELKDAGMGLLSIAGALLIYSVSVAYRANMKNFRNTVLVVLTKQILAGLLVLFGALLIGGVKSGIESRSKAGKVSGNSAEDRKTAAQHKKDSNSAFMVAAIAAAMVYPLYKMIKSLIKEHPKQA